MFTDIQKKDIAHHIHAQTNLALHEKLGPTVMVRGEGCYTFDDKGRQFLDAMSGMWSATLGYSETRLIEAAERQLRKLPYQQNFAHRTSEPATELAARLVQMAPVPMSKVVFSCSGSEAVDTAMKLAWYYWAGIGQPQRRKMLTRKRSYHGTTIGAASLTGLPHMHKDFALPIPGMVQLTCPHFYREGLPGETEADFVKRLAAELETTIVQEGPETIAAFFAEPVMGTGGVVVAPDGYFSAIQKILKKYDILLVADEVICGFGRTGNMWGSQTMGMQPDMITCAKGLSASYLPISALLINERVYDAMRSQSEKIGIFGHGYTYGGHPVPAAVALEALDIYEERQLPANAKRMGDRLMLGLQSMSGHPLVGEVRGKGLMAAIELVQNKTTKAPFDPSVKAGMLVGKAAEAQGVVVRPLGDTICIAPPLIVSEEEIDRIVETLRHGLNEAERALAA
ncbi:aminotransferase [Ottowia thiooxydans]|uniref:aminotransferase n=1 Tax=Ottowia thiooxydans TaxID=219182 RepID=UPI0004059F9C|nr:aminotransferase [Ottowia thiooxydans]